jgi:hypothetical protein
MKQVLRFVAALGLFATALPGYAQQFKAYDIIINPHGNSLAAYQLELIADDADARIVGVEGGDHPAFQKAPYYDPAALQSGRIIVAAFNTGTNLPNQVTRVATVHMIEPDDCDSGYTMDLTVAVDTDGNDIDADIELLPVEGETR